MAKPDKPDDLQRFEYAGITVYIDQALMPDGDSEIVFLFPGLGRCKIRIKQQIR